MKQHLSKYTTQDQKIWKYLFTRQHENIDGKVCIEYLECLEKLSSVLNESSIPDFTSLNKLLMKATGWSIQVVPGLIEAEEFFNFLRQKKFCSSTWLRSKEQLHYISEPDMFHDIFGHIPLFMNADYADFAQRIGEMACKWKKNAQKIRKLQRLYWFTIEFGVIRRNNKVKSYGAGIISSITEVNKIDQLEGTFMPYDISEIIEKEYNIDTVQPCYFVIEKMSDLYDSLDRLEMILESH